MIKKILEKYPAIGQFIRFALIGGINTGIDLVILNILIFSTNQNEGVAYSSFKTISFIVAATSSYFMNKYWAFKDKSKKKEVQKFSQFFVVSVVGAIINVSIATIVITYLKPIIGSDFLFLNDNLWGTVGALFGTAIGLIWNFIGYKFIVFKK